jgi:TatD DNase family protein
MQLIDTHAHLDQLQDLSGALQRAQEAGVSDIMAMSVDEDSMRKTLELNLDPVSDLQIHPALGVHPGMVKSGAEQKNALDFLRANIQRAKAVGETGLDYWYKWARKDEAQRKIQQDSFDYHIKLALEFNLPLVVHSRGAWSDCLAMLKSAGTKRGLFHWYSGPLDVLAKIIDAGYYVSAGPSLAYSPQLREAMTASPLERILIETDSPVCYKDEEQSFMAEPKDVVKAAKALAELKSLDKEKMMTTVNANAKYFFGVG